MIWLGASLAAIRHARGMSILGLSDSAGVSASYVGQLEHDGERAPSPEIVQALARALNVTLEALAIDVPAERLAAELASKFEPRSSQRDVDIEVLTLLRDAS